MTFAPPSSRNAPCPCGSGRRYKECHGALAGAEPQAEPLEALLQRALAAHQAGVLELAASLYDQALARDPRHFDAMHMRGVVELQAGRFEQAVALIGRAVALRPDVPAALQNLALARSALDRTGFEERYAQWITRVERPRREARAQARRAAAGHPSAPRFSIVMPTYESREDHLVASLESILAQEWPHWELCIADDASPSPHVRRILAGYAARDPRVRVTYRADNGHISAASNTALAMASAPFVALVDHDDVLAPHALAEMALGFLAHPDAAIVYSDEDKLDERGRRVEPYFKPDWNPVLVAGENFVSHLGVYRAALMREAGGFRSGVEGAQDWDLLLRCVERVPPSAIRHVPHILYHWRVSEASTARSMESKRYAAAAQERVVREALARSGLDGELRRVAFGAFLAVDLRPARAPRVSLVLLTGDGGDEAAWRASAGEALVDMVRVDAEPAVLDGRSRGIAPAAVAVINEAVGRSQGEVVVVADARFAPPPRDLFAAWVAHAAIATHGPVGALIVDAMRTIAGGWLALDPERVAVEVGFGEPLGTPGMGGRLMLAQNVSAVRVDAMAVRGALWRSLGGLDATGLQRCWREVDFCLRSSAAGFRPVWHPEVVLASPDFRASGGEEGEQSLADGDDGLMRARWAAALAHDAAYPDDLTRGPRWFDLA